MVNFFEQLKNKIVHYEHKYFDKPHKAALHLFAWSLKSIFKKWNVVERTTNRTIQKSIFFDLQGGIGDIIIAINYLVQLHSKFCNKLKFYIIVPDVFNKIAPQLISKYDFIILTDRTAFDKKWLAEIDLCRIPNIKHAQFDAIKNISKKLYDWIKYVYDFNQNHTEYLKSGTVSDFLLTKYTQLDGRNRLNQADIGHLVDVKSVYKLHITSEAPILKHFGIIKDSYVTLQCGAGALSGKALSTREWDIKKYNELIGLIKQVAPDLTLIQIGNAGDPTMNVDLDLRGKTDFNEFLCVLKNAKLHIGGESGCVHMRHFMGERSSVVLFGPTFKDFYSYPENINISSEICPGCEWVHNDWREFCLRSGSKAICLQKLQPKFVFQKIEHILKNKD